ncbi:MAG: hypothetical protein RXP77_03860 [Nitrososphaeria archaeon]
MPGQERGSKRGARRLISGRYRRILDLVMDVRNWYAAAMIVLAAGLINYTLTGSRVPPLAFVPPAYLQQSIGETVTLAILVGLGLYFVALSGRSGRSDHEGVALALALASAALLVVWYLVVLAIGGMIRWRPSR